jgi:hypothetical protein
MGLGASRQNITDSTWLETEAQHMLTTTKNIGTVETICSLVPFINAPIDQLMKRSDLDILFTIHCRRQNLHREQSHALEMTNNTKAKELWHVLRFLSRRSPWDWNWQPPLTGDPSKIAHDFHINVSRAVFRVLFFELVSYALGYSVEVLSMGALLSAVCDVRNMLQRRILDIPETKKTYTKVEQVSLGHSTKFQDQLE